MNLQDLVAQNRLQPHPPSVQEIGDLWRVVDESIADAGVAVISLDLRFSSAYDAALTLANIALRCAGYRTRGVAHHVTTFEALPLVMGSQTQARATMFDGCRVMRNVGHYKRRGQVTVQQVEELATAVADFRGEVREWVRANSPEYLPPDEI